jgi:hypothetical protein
MPTDSGSGRGLTLLIECKQSPLPYVFFLSQGSVVPEVPLVVGLRSPEIVVTTDDDHSTWHPKVLHALGQDLGPFVVDPPTCATLSKCVRKGSEISLSGEESYNSVVLPLMSASSHYERVARPPDTAFYFELSLALAVAVLDAPMVGVSLTENGSSLSLVPWVRLVRHEPSREASMHGWFGRLGAIDFVHAEFVETYLRDHAEPLADEVGRAAQRHHEELATGRGFAVGLGADSWTDFEARLRPRTFSVPPPVRVLPEGLSRLVVRQAREWAVGRYKIWLATRPRRRAR